MWSFMPGCGVRPMLGHTLNGSAHASTKEMRFHAGDGLWGAFAFDPERQAVLLAVGDGSGRDDAARRAQAAEQDAGQRR